MSAVVGLEVPSEGGFSVLILSADVGLDVSSVGGFSVLLLSVGGGVANGISVFNEEGNQYCRENVI